jgi:phosphatidylglycerophosphate synthase
MTAQTWTRRPLKSRSTPWAARLTQWLVKARVHPDRISQASLVAAGVAGFCLLRHWWLAAALSIQLRLLCNLLDGMVAIEGGRRSAAGEIYNDLPDRISDALILLAAGYALAWPGFARELGWSAALAAVMTAYVRTLGGACGLPQDFRGPMAKPQRMAVLTLACLCAPFDQRSISLALAIVVAGSLVTAGLRLRRIVQLLEKQS